MRSTEGDFTIRNLRDGFDTMLQETVARIADYRGALDTGAFHLSFQPIVRLSDRSVHHHEALSRAEDGAPIGSVVSFAEELNMVAEFDMMVCRRVADLLAGTGGRRLSIAANLSGRSLENPAFAGALLEMLGRYPQIRGRMLLELTETAQVHDLEKVNAVLQELRRRGFQVCLDDFGSGAATFHYLRAFQVDFVKIDGSLIRSQQSSRPCGAAQRGRPVPRDQGRDDRRDGRDRRAGELARARAGDPRSGLSVRPSGGRASGALSG